MVTPLITQINLVTAQLSAVAGLGMVTLFSKQFPGKAVCTTGAGQIMVGGWLLSVMVTVCTQVATFPQASVAVQVTVLIPTGN